jgi:hypothetical protein
LRHRDVKTIRQLVDELTVSYTVPGQGRPLVRLLEEVADVREWLEPHCEKVITDVTGSYETHEFRFERRFLEGECRCFVSTKPYCVFDDFIDAGFPLIVSRRFGTRNLRMTVSSRSLPDTVEGACSTPS